MWQLCSTPHLSKYITAEVTPTSGRGNECYFTFLQNGVMLEAVYVEIGSVEGNTLHSELQDA